MLMMRMIVPLGKFYLSWLIFLQKGRDLTNTPTNIDVIVNINNMGSLNAAKGKLFKSEQSITTFCSPIFLYNVNINHPREQFETKTPKITFKVKTK